MPCAALTFWFPAQYRARILAGFLVAIPFSTVVGAPLSGLLLELDGIFGLAGWKWLLILEGLPAVVFGFVSTSVTPSMAYSRISSSPPSRTWRMAMARCAPL